MNVLSLFSGVGGFDLGLEAASMKTIYQCELDKHARTILDRHWPEVPKWDDVSTLTAEEILRHGRNPDVVAWGSPCQDLSLAGKRAGLSGGRSGLFYEGMRIIKELRRITNNAYPRISIWENVPGALSSNRGADFGVILDEMAQAGAVVIEWAILDAQHFGVPQRRRRVFVIAIFDPAIARNCPSPLLPVSKSVRRNTAKGKSKGETSPHQASTSIGSESFRMREYGDYANDDIASAIKSRDHKDATDLVVEPMLIDGTRVNDVRVYEPPVQTLKERMGTGGNNVPLIAQEILAYDEYNNTLNEIHHALRAGTKQSTGVLVGSSEPVMPALISGMSRVTCNSLEWYVNAIHSVQPTMAVRRLTPLECERLMGWPDDHTRWKADGTEQSDTQRYKQCGNGVASPVAEWIGRHVMGVAQ